MFQPGKPKTGGRQKGVVNKKTKNYLDFQMWFQVIKDNMEALPEEKRIEVAFRVAAMLFTKVNNLPMSPAESAENAQARVEMMNALETGKVETNAAIG